MNNYITFKNNENTFQFNQNNIIVDQNDQLGVIRAVNDLSSDLNKVTERKFEVKNSIEPNSIIVGTIGKSKIIDQLIANNKIDVSQIKGQWESFLIQTVDDCLVIVGSDKRGTIFGIYDICEKIGVSPWYWWADVPVKKHNVVGVKNGTYISPSPKVKYRGIFINDEEPSFGGWAREKFGGINSKLYAHIFELILRLKGNYMWPAMWGKAFNTDDSNNPVVADEYGVVMGTCHHEPMMCSQQEWQEYSNNGNWNYNTNKEKIYQFWKRGINRNAKFENIVTIGMRGEHDQAMYGGNNDILRQVIEDQRNLISEAYNKPASEVPQLWAVYKEVQSYYDSGMRVPDDVTILWSDDNWGNVRRLPTPEERKRSGGAGIYYHLDFVGGPRSYRWLNTSPLPKMWEQLNLTYRYGADRIWILNVGDLKPMELPIDFFFKFAFDPNAINQNQIKDYTVNWAKEQFGNEYAEEIADIVSKYTKYNGWRKPELINERTYHLINDHEWDRVLKLWEELVTRAENLKENFSQEYQDAYFELVLHPVKASAQIIKLFNAVAKNQLYYQQRRVSISLTEREIYNSFKADKELSDYYNNTLANGKWHHMMDQPHIGVAPNGWDSPNNNIFPGINRLSYPLNSDIGVAVENSNYFWPKVTRLTLPSFDSWNPTTHTFEIFRLGGQGAKIIIRPLESWIKTSITGGVIINDDLTVEVSIDWQLLENGTNNGCIEIEGSNGTVPIQITAVKAENIKQVWGAHTGPISIPAYKSSKINTVNDITWDFIPDYGRSEGGMTIFPVTTESITDYTKAPSMEYPIYINETNDYSIILFTSPTLNFVPGRGLRIAVGIDDNEPRVIDAYNGWVNWDQMVIENYRKMRTSLNISEGKHILKIYMVDPAIVVEKIIVSSNSVLPTYFGPKFSNFIK